MFDNYLYQRLNNVRYQQMANGVNLKNGFDYYFKQFGHKSQFTPENIGYEVPERASFWVAHYGPGEFNSFCGFGSILEEVKGAPEQCQLLKDIIYIRRYYLQINNLKICN